MSNLDHSIQYDIQSPVNSWLKKEQQGEKFPVPFEDAWKIAGHSRKDSAKRKLVDQGYFEQGEAFHISVERSPHKGSEGYSTREDITLSVDTFKELCMLSRSDTGKATRRYFIECEKKWRLVQKHHPEVAESVEERLMDKAIALESLRLKNN